ncbi:nucleotide exchange factor GrpE [Halorarius halobius]|uniref:nucleotide exchange factor GrpE n=1 Tax=Halorarius halobius TaxID=2962671 RepID=UPI0020CDED2E|nr:nucleotide exchange factor GrpE [Halorarius halobius]
MSENEGAETATDSAAGDDATAGETAPADDPVEDVDPDEELVDRVREASAEDAAREIAALRERVDALETSLADERERGDDLESKLKRKQADFQNFKKRQKQKTEEARQRATEDLVERLLDVRDNLVRALDQDEDADIRSGVETTLRGFDDVLDAENVEPIEPDAGADLDPVRHEVLMRVDSDQPEGTVADLHRAGYEMAGKVLRPAQVTVADGSE